MPIFTKSTDLRLPLKENQLDFGQNLRDVGHVDHDTTATAGIPLTDHLAILYTELPKWFV